MLKKRRENVLYIPEFAMECVVNKRFAILEDQLAVFAEQAHRLYNAKDQFDYVVTDAPLFLSLHYMLDANAKFNGSNEKYWKLTLTDLVMQTWGMYENTVYFVDRKDRKFLQTGRIQNEEQSKEIDTHVLKILSDQDIEYTTISNADQALADLIARGIISN